METPFRVRHPCGGRSRRRGPVPPVVHWQHLQITIGVAKRHDRPAADCWMIPTGLPALSSMKLDLEQANTGSPSRTSNLVLMLLPDDLLGRDTVDRLCPRPHEPMPPPGR